MVLVALFSGFIIALISMIGEYVVRTLQTVSTRSPSTSSSGSAE